MNTSTKTSLQVFDPKLVRPALVDAFKKLSPKTQLKNPVMFVVYVGSILTTLLFFQALRGEGEAPAGFILAISLWLWFTVLFANFAEALAEGRSKAQAASLPISPKKSQNAALISFASLLFGTFWTITRALFTGARSGGRTFVEPSLNTRSANKKSEPVLAAKLVKADVAKADIAAATENAIGLETSIASVVERIKRAAPKEGGHRAMVSGETMVIDASQEAIDIAKDLADGGNHVILVDWSPSGQGLAATAGVTAAQGLTELLTGAVGFDDVVQKLPQSPVHFISCGAPLDGVDVDPDQLNLVLDALDEAYDYIVVSGQNEDARVLFEAIQGRFDAGILVTDPKKRTSVLQDPPGTFLGFEVTDIDVICVERKGPGPVSSQRLIRATKKAGSEVRTG